MHKQPIVRFWVLTAQRGWARFILGRVDALVSAASARGNAAGHVDSVAGQRSFFYPNHGNGTVNSAGFGWRGNVLKFLWCMFLCLSCCELSLDNPHSGA